MLNYKKNFLKKRKQKSQMNTIMAEGKGTNIYLVPIIFQALENTYVLVNLQMYYIL